MADVEGLDRSFECVVEALFLAFLEATLTPCSSYPYNSLFGSR